MSQNESCQFKIMDRVYYADFNEVKQKIKKGTILRNDQVKVGESIWTEAQQIPEFSRMFEDFESENKIPDGVDLQNIFTNFQLSGISKIQHEEIQTFNNKTCAIHQENLPYYVCSICKTLFCKDCFASDNSFSSLPDVSMSGCFSLAILCFSYFIYSSSRRK